MKACGQFYSIYRQRSRCNIIYSTPGFLLSTVRFNHWDKCGDIKIRCHQTIPGTIDIGNSIATNPAENKIYIHPNKHI